MTSDYLRLDNRPSYRPVLFADTVHCFAIYKALTRTLLNLLCKRCRIVVARL